MVRFALAAATALLAVNLWTGAPLLAIWCGSRVQNSTGLTMTTVGVVLGVLSVTVALLVFLLTRVEAAYRVATGQETRRRRATWLRSMRDERADYAERRPMSGYEKVLVGAVVAAVLAFEAWFFLFAGSSIGSG
ncbi:hypothetical protein [Kribbella sp.]|uniref:hypothetical protein n=1 Tax=Kribbella sp. TaxID=1871183 RepID=UPI002D58819F|nr:hypothetical protein [Kribbella sp.]HZX07080.1 hypothetical protein [Kribbella sp.]